MGHLLIQENVCITEADVLKGEPGVAGRKNRFFLHKSIFEHHENVLPKPQNEIRKFKPATAAFATEQQVTQVSPENFKRVFL